MFVQLFLAVLSFLMFGVQELDVMLIIGGGADDLGGQVDRRFGDKPAFGGLAGRFILLGLDQSGSDRPGDQPGHGQGDHHQQPEQQNAAVHGAVSPSGPPLPGAVFPLPVSSNGFTILYNP